MYLTNELRRFLPKICQYLLASFGVTPFRDATGETRYIRLTEESYVDFWVYSSPYWEYHYDEGAGMTLVSTLNPHLSVLDAWRYWPQIEPINDEIYDQHFPDLVRFRPLILCFHRLSEKTDLPDQVLGELVEALTHYPTSRTYHNQNYQPDDESDWAG